jgi:hypothetical protein
MSTEHERRQKANKRILVWSGVLGLAGLTLSAIFGKRRVTPPSHELPVEPVEIEAPLPGHPGPSRGHCR